MQCVIHNLCDCHNIPVSLSLLILYFHLELHYLSAPIVIHNMSIICVHLTIFLTTFIGLESATKGEVYPPERVNLDPAPTYLKDDSAVTFPIFAPFVVTLLDYLFWLRK